MRSGDRLRSALYLSVFSALTASAAACFATTDIDSFCAPKIEVPSALLATRVIIFGETHGTVEAPRFVGRYLCQAASSGRTVILGLEMQTAEQRLIDEFLASPGNSDDVAALLSGAHWHHPFQDGRSSEAMFGLLDGVRALRASGMNVSVGAFDGYEKGVDRDATMAANLRRTILRDTSASVVVLVGNVHASKKLGASFNPEFEPMAYLLRDAQPVSLDIRTTGGSAWVCTSPKPPTTSCGVTALWASVQPGRAAELEFGSEEPDTYDGTYFVGPILASPPKAVSAAD